MRRQWPVLLVVALLAAVGGYFAAMQMDSGQGGPGIVSSDPATEVIGQRRPDFSHPALDGRPVSAGDFNGRVLLVNFWATWCQPCVEEMPMLSALQNELSEQGFRVVGIALDDAARAARFASDMDLSYPVLTGAADVVVTGRRYGNASGMLPYSVLVDAEGVIRWTELGALDRGVLERQLRDLLAVN